MDCRNIERLNIQQISGETLNLIVKLYILHTEIKKEFIHNVEDLCKLLFNEENFKCKTVGGKKLKCLEFFEYFKVR